jgi:1-acyl-sn-glycerol-3-phosphate acyltransferase
MLVFGFSYCVITPFLSFRGRFWLAGVMSHVIFAAARVLCGIRYTVEGRENLPPGNHVIFMKHSSTWETFGIMILFPPLVWVMKREILWIPFVGWGCLLASCIAIDRKAGFGRQPGARAGQGPWHAGPGYWCFRRHAHGRRRTRRYGKTRNLVVSRAGECKIVRSPTTRDISGPAAECSRNAAHSRHHRRVVAAGRDAREVNNELQAWIEVT